MGSAGSVSAPQALGKGQDPVRVHLIDERLHEGRSSCCGGLQGVALGMTMVGSDTGAERPFGRCKGHLSCEPLGAVEWGSRSANAS